MNVNELEGINSNTMSILAKNGWTVDKLATASPEQLAVIPRIGLKTARDVIRAAREVVNLELLEESKKPEYVNIPDAPVQRSVRVRRIYGEKV